MASDGRTTTRKESLLLRRKSACFIFCGVGKMVQVLYWAKQQAQRLRRKNWWRNYCAGVPVKEQDTPHNAQNNVVFSGEALHGGFFHSFSKFSTFPIA